MKKLKVPKLINLTIDEELAKKDMRDYYENHWDDLIPWYSFDVGNFYVKADVDFSYHMNGYDEYYMYAFISDTKYLDDAIVIIDDFPFHTYAQWKKAVKDMSKQLIQRWKIWVNNLYTEE